MAETSLPEQYHGPITPAQAAEGIQHAVTNATNLYAEAQLLLTAQHWERGAVLAIQSMEEAIKPRQLRVLLLAKTRQELLEAWSAYRQLDLRHLVSLRGSFVYYGSNRIDEDMVPLFDEPSHISQWLYSLKQRGLSVDAYDNGRWSVPFSAITESVASKLVTSAKRIVFSIPSAMSSAPELTLWVKHLKPIWPCRGYELSKAIWACYREAQDCGVLASDMSTWAEIRAELAIGDESDGLWRAKSFMPP
ncbi:MAG: AbiV family abortive infection protein [Nitrospirales bacterium]